MFNKKHIFILLLLIVGICAMSSVSAADNVTDFVATDEAPAGDVVTALGEKVSDDAVALNQEESDDVESQDVLKSTGNDSALAQSESGEVLSAYPITYDYYTVEFEDSYTISAKTGGVISFYMKPCQINGFYAYNYHLYLFQGPDLDHLEITKNVGHFASESNRRIGDWQYQFKANELEPGDYILVAVNDRDQKVMSATNLYVKGTAVIAANNYNAYYNSGTRMPIKVTDKATGKILKYVRILAVFSNGKTSVKKVYTTSKYGMISVVPPVNVGTWTLTLSSYDNHLSASAVKRTVVVKKANVAIKAYNVKRYEGLSVILKAVVKSQGKNVNHGIVTFILNGKSYNVKVKNGIAAKTVVMPKSKIYRYYAIFKSVNFNSPKKTYATAVSLKRYATKIVAKNVVAYRVAGSLMLNIAIRTASGAIVNKGTVLINGEEYDINRYGIVQLVLPADMNYVGNKGLYSTVYYKKVAKKAYVIKYIPSSLQLKPSIKKIVFTQLYRCTTCGSTTSHRHSDGRTFIVS